MYTASTAEDVKDMILQEFTSLDSVIRVVIATIAFGMGLNAPDIRHCIHWGSADTVQAYVVVVDVMVMILFPLCIFVKVIYHKQVTYLK